MFIAALRLVYAVLAPVIRLAGAGRKAHGHGLDDLRLARPFALRSARASGTGSRGKAAMYPKPCTMHYAILEYA